MKRTCLLLALLLSASFLFAQEETKKSTDEIKTVFGKGKKAKLGWFVGIDPGYTAFGSKSVWLAGLSTGMIINHNFTIGLTGRAWVNRNSLYYPAPIITDTVGAYLSGGYGGLLFEYTLFPKSVVHVTFPVMIGAGGAAYVTEREYYQWDDKDWNHGCRTLDSDAFFVLEPGIRAEVNLLKFMRLNAGISYRYVGDLQLKNTPADFMSNFTANIGLKFGKF